MSETRDNRDQGEHTLRVGCGKTQPMSNSSNLRVMEGWLHYGTRWLHRHLSTERCLIATQFQRELLWIVDEMTPRAVRAETSAVKRATHFRLVLWMPNQLP